jgi:hypothetical protein
VNGATYVYYYTVVLFFLQDGTLKIAEDAASGVPTWEYVTWQGIYYGRVKADGRKTVVDD